MLAVYRLTIDRQTDRQAASDDALGRGGDADGLFAQDSGSSFDSTAAAASRIVVIIVIRVADCQL